LSRRETLRPEGPVFVGIPVGLAVVWLGWIGLLGSFDRVGGGLIGVVKLLRARGGCLGVIRIRAWKAAICPGELPNER
jgi:hypothetical protein